jgi:malate dehydrogenase (oxaloacetate-decarboxylating)(NADP+)
MWCSWTTAGHAAAGASADQVGPSLRARGMLFPSQANILETEVTTATRIAEFMFDKGLAQASARSAALAWMLAALLLLRSIIGSSSAG